MNYLNSTKHLNRKSGVYPAPLSNRKSGAGFTLIELIVVMAVFLFVTGASMGIFISIITSQKRLLAQEQFLNQISYLEEYMAKALRMAKTAPNSDCIPEGFIYLLTRHPENTGDVYNGIKFINQSDNGSCWEFFLDTTDSERPFLARRIGTDTAILAIPLTSTNFQFDLTNPIRFAISKKDGSIGDGSVFGQGCTGVEANKCGAEANIVGTEYPQPRVTIVLNILIPGGDQSTSENCNSSRDCLVASQACDFSVHKCAPTRIIQTTVSRRNLNVAR